jgi:hypothetical protein
MNLTLEDKKANQQHLVVHRKMISASICKNPKAQIKLVIGSLHGKKKFYREHEQKPRSNLGRSKI